MRVAPLTASAAALAFAVAASAPVATAQVIERIPLPQVDSSPMEITAAPNGDLWISEQATSTLIRVSAATEKMTTFALPAMSAVPFGIAVAPDGNVWYSEPWGDRIGFLSPAGKFTPIALPTPGTGPSTVSVAANGDVWYCGFDGNRVGRYRPSTRVFREYPLPVEEGRPRSIAFMGGFVWIAYGGKANAILKLDEESGDISSLPIPTADSQPYRLVAAADGTLWFTELYGNRIGRVADGVVTEIPTPTPNSSPRGLTIAPDGTVWFVETGPAKRIGRVNRSGSIEELSVPMQYDELHVGPYSFLPLRSGSFQGIAARPDGTLWFTDQQWGKLGRVQFGFADASGGSGAGGLTIGR